MMRRCRIVTGTKVGLFLLLMATTPAVAMRDSGHGPNREVSPLSPGLVASRTFGEKPYINEPTLPLECRGYHVRPHAARILTRCE